MSKRTFRGGVHPMKHEGKDKTRNEAVREFMPDTVIIPMSMSIGAPSVVCAVKSSKVKIGQKIGDPQGFLGIPVHASIAGTVKNISELQQLGGSPVVCVEIENDFSNETSYLEPMGDVEKADPGFFVSRIKEAGICGMGGATFPTHVKLSVPEGKSCDTIIINGAECETFLTSDFRLMVEEPNKVVDGLRAVMRALNVNRGVICIEDNKPEALKAIRAAAAGRTGVEVMELITKYPQGSEKQLIKAVTGREVKRGQLPIDANTIVLNAATAAAITDAIVEGKPLVSRITTVTGSVQKPSNLRVPIGTVLSDIIGACDGFVGEPGKILLGGGMTAPCAPNDSVVITKGAGGVVVFDEKSAKRIEEGPCIRCSGCVHVCPMGLTPYSIKFACEKDDTEAAKDAKIMDCILCGCCSFVCPAYRYLTPAFKTMKDKIAAESRRAKQ